MRSDSVQRVVRLLLPDDQDTRLLRACLWSGIPAATAWNEWRSGVTSLEMAFGQRHSARRRLMPLLHHALRRNGVRPDAQDLAYLRAAYLHETRRSEQYTRVLLEALSALAGVQVIVLKGAALAHTVYDEPALRHCHDIDLLVPPDERNKAEARLTAAGFRRATSAESAGDLTLIHSSGLPVVIHHQLFAQSIYCLNPEDVWGRTRVATIEEAAVRVLAPVDAFLHVCAHASYSKSRASLVWVCDAFLASASGGVDSQELLQEATRRNLTVPLIAITAYLVDELRLPIERSTVEALASASRSAGRAGRDAAVAGVLAGRNQRLIELIARARGWDARWLVIRARLESMRG